MPLATPTLAVADNANLTATATITVGDAGATNTLYSQTVDETGGATWVSRGSRTGNGTITTAAFAAAQYAWWKVESVLGAEKTVSNLVYQAVTDGTEAYHKRILDAVRAKILTLSLSGITSDVVYTRWLPTDHQLVKDAGKDKLPAIFVCPAGVEQEQGGPNASDDVGYPVFIGLVDNVNQTPGANLALYLKLREQLIAAFRTKHLTISPNQVIMTTIEPLPVVDVNQWNNNLFASGFVLRCKVRQARPAN